MNTGVAKAGLGIKRPLVGTEIILLLFYSFISIILGIKRPLVGTEIRLPVYLAFLPHVLGIKRPLVGTEIRTLFSIHQYCVY